MPGQWLKIAITTFIAFSLCACALSPQPEKTLYQQLGEDKGIEAIVHELILIIATDERVKPRYKGVNMQRFKEGLSDYICSISGGPCQYRGDSMQVVHAGHQYTNAEFNAIVDNLILAMERRGLAVATQNRLLKILAPSYKDIVYQ
jgi:hemoglobin